MTTDLSEARLIEAAKSGDEQAFEALIAPQRGKLHAHCYRMLGSVHDAEDALQEAYVRTWKGLPKFDGRSALGSWLYRIATNACLTAIERRPKRMLAIEDGHIASGPGDAAAEPWLDPVWIEPYPDGQVELETEPGARYEARESLELAFIAALQNLPPNQRAALILAEVLGFSAKETADALETSTASINSALQRARKVVEEQLPERSQQANLRQLGDDELNGVVERYMKAMDEADIDAIVAMLREDATWSMPPQPAWFRGHAAIAEFLVENPFKWFEWRHLPITANGQAAVGCYSWNEQRRTWAAHSVNVLELDGDRIASITSFLDVTRRGVEDPRIAPFVGTGVLASFGLPDESPVWPPAAA